ncbi:MAG: (S)-benzoin forming benzil reductase [Balneolales bacterium]
MKHVIITGASKGFGLSLARKMIGTGQCYHLIARSRMDDLVSDIEKQGATVFQYTFDLSQTAEIEGLMNRIAENIAPETTTFVALINNAGMLSPIGPMGKYDAGTYHKNLQVNFTAPAMLSHGLIANFQHYKATKRIVMVSSGAANNPYYGWSHYCSTKAGVDMLTKCIALEQSKMEFPVQCISFNPGRMETDMQREIRKVSKDDFEMVEDFIRAKNQGELGDPDIIAAMLAEQLFAKNFPNGEIVSRKQLGVKQ